MGGLHFPSRPLLSLVLKLAATIQKIKNPSLIVRYWVVQMQSLLIYGDSCWQPVLRIRITLMLIRIPFFTSMRVRIHNRLLT
jgi:hypothetical protein